MANMMRRGATLGFSGPGCIISLYTRTQASLIKQSHNKDYKDGIGLLTSRVSSQ